MPRKRYSTEQIVTKLRQAEVELSRGLRTPQVCKPAARLIRHPVEPRLSGDSWEGMSSRPAWEQVEDHPGSSDEDDVEVPAGEGVPKNHHMMREHVRRRGYVPIWNTPHHSHHAHQCRLTVRRTPAPRGSFAPDPLAYRASAERAA